MTDTQFGLPPHERQAQAQRAARERRAKVNTPVGDSTKLNHPKRARVAIVDEDREVAVQVLYSTVIFRPNQEIRDKRLLEIAKANHIRLRYRE